MPPTKPRRLTILQPLPHRWSLSSGGRRGQPFWRESRTRTPARLSASSLAGPRKCATPSSTAPTSGMRTLTSASRSPPPPLSNHTRAKDFRPVWLRSCLNTGSSQGTDESTTRTAADTEIEGDCLIYRWHCHMRCLARNPRTTSVFAAMPMTRKTRWNWDLNQ